MIRLRVALIAILFGGLYSPPLLSSDLVLTTTTTLKSMVEPLLKDVSVEALVGADQDPHHIDIKPSQMLEIKRAKIVIAVGFGLEDAWLNRLLRQNKDVKVIYVGEMLTSPLKNQKAEDHGHSHSGHSHGHKDGHKHADYRDPHFLNSPKRILDIYPKLAEELKKKFPKQKKAIDRSLKKLLSELQAIDKDFKKQIQAISPLIAYHDSLKYLETDYELNVLTVIEAGHGVQPGPKQIAKIKNLIKDNRDIVIVADTTSNLNLIERHFKGTKIKRLPSEVGALNSPNQLLDWLKYYLEKLAG